MVPALQYCDIGRLLIQVSVNHEGITVISIAPEGCPGHICKSFFVCLVFNFHLYGVCFRCYKTILGFRN